MCLMYIKYNYAPSVMLLQSIYCAYSECIQLNILSTLLGDHLCKSLLFESQTSVSYNINCVIKYLNLNVSWPGTLLAETMADGTTKFLRDFCVHEITALMGGWLQRGPTNAKSSSIISLKRPPPCGTPSETREKAYGALEIENRVGKVYLSAVPKMIKANTVQ